MLVTASIAVRAHSLLIAREPSVSGFYRVQLPPSEPSGCRRSKPQQPRILRGHVVVVVVGGWVVVVVGGWVVVVGGRVVVVVGG